MPTTCAETCSSVPRSSILKIPVVIALTMMDLAAKKGIEIDVPGLERELGVPVVPVNPRKNKGMVQLKKIIAQRAQHLHQAPVRDFIPNSALATDAVNQMRQVMPEISDYTALHYLINHESFPFKNDLHQRIENIEEANQFNHTRVQAEEILQRYTPHPPGDAANHFRTRSPAKNPVHRKTG